MDCTLNKPCPTCDPVFSACADQTGGYDAAAEILVDCLNSRCSKP